jgi:hypothetical protein
VTHTSTEQAAAKRAKTADKIRKLLAMAADPSVTDDERATFAAKAADLMTRAGIDEAQLRVARGEGPEPVEVYPYAVAGAGGQGQARAAIAYRVAEALGCRALVNFAPTPRPWMTIIVGVGSDVATLRTLLPLVMTQAETAATRAAATQAPGRRGGFVASFLVAYGETVAQRIAQRRGNLAQEAAATGTGADVILADRDARVRAAYEAKFPSRGTVSVPGANQAGAAAGRQAGRRAYLGDGLTVTERAALPPR